MLIKELDDDEKNPLRFVMTFDEADVGVGWKPACFEVFYEVNDIRRTHKYLVPYEERAKSPFEMGALSLTPASAQFLFSLALMQAHKCVPVYEDDFTREGIKAQSLVALVLMHTDAGWTLRMSTQHPDADENQVRTYRTLRAFDLRGAAPDIVNYTMLPRYKEVLTPTRFVRTYVGVGSMCVFLQRTVTTIHACLRNGVYKQTRRVVIRSRQDACEPSSSPKEERRRLQTYKKLMDNFGHLPFYGSIL